MKAHLGWLLAAALPCLAATPAPFDPVPSSASFGADRCSIGAPIDIGLVDPPGDVFGPPLDVALFITEDDVWLRTRIAGQLFLQPLQRDGHPLPGDEHLPRAVNCASVTRLAQGWLCFTSGSVSSLRRDGSAFGPAVRLEHATAPVSHDLGASAVVGNRLARVTWGLKHEQVWWWELVMDAATGVVTEQLRKLPRPRLREHPIPAFPVTAGQRLTLFAPDLNGFFIDGTFMPLPKVASPVVKGESFEWMRAQWEGSAIFLMSTPGNGSGVATIARIQPDGRAMLLENGPPASELSLSVSGFVQSGAKANATMSVKLGRHGARHYPSVQFELPRDARYEAPLWSGTLVLLPFVRPDAHLRLLPIRCNAT